MTRAFSLIEILIALGIILLVAALSIPAVAEARKRADSARCLENLRSIGVGLNVYVTDHEQRMPDLQGSRASTDQDVAVIDVILAPYVQKASAFHCPFDEELAEVTGTSYQWNAGLNKQPAAGLKFVLGELVFDDLSNIPVLNDKKDWHTGRKNFLYADGSVGNHPLKVKN
jgi:prepilin-type processing-associated H-X9-DG protein/prepilin-type N-terminal cleavage/methylation domain-containing protein